MVPLHNTPTISHLSPLLPPSATTTSCSGTSTVTALASDNWPPPPPHSQASSLLSSTGPQTRPHNRPPTRPSQHSGHLLGPTLAQLVLKTHDHVFASRPPLLVTQYLSFGFSDVTFSPYGAYWRQARKIYVTELLSSKRVSSFELVRDVKVNPLISSVSTQTGVATNISELFFNLASDILCRVALGKRFMGESRGEERKKPDLATILTETQSLLAGFCIGHFFPEWERVNSVSGMKRRLKNLEELREVCDEHVKKRERKGNIQDFVEVLLRVQERDDLEVPITHDNLKALVLDMFVAGTDTTSSTLEWTMNELARHPTVMVKAEEEEVQKIASTKGKVEQTDLHHLHYLKAVIKETMRPNPPVPLLVLRESMEDCILNSYNILAKTRVLINTYAIGRDPVSWENPLEFNPDRFEDADADADFKGKDFKFLPFGGGWRGCPGFSFGLVTVEIALARHLYHFDWGLPDGVGAEDLDLEEIFGLAMRKKSALVLVPKYSQSDSAH
ncbi:unnamed protein product [Camellia sinensis]